MATWARGPGVVELPGGRRVRARALRHRAPAGPDPQFGVYLVGRPPAHISWDHRWVRCPDFRSPSDTVQACHAIREAFDRAEHERVEVGCGGGIGRTGMALAVLAIYDGVDPAAAVAWVRHHHHHRAVETPFQRRWVARVTADASRSWAAPD